MTNAEFLKRAEEILQTLDGEKYSDLYELLSGIVKRGEEYTELYDAAADIFNCDESEVFPSEVSELMREILEDEIKRGNADAMCDLGALYYTGRIGEQSYEKAVYYYEASAKLGNAQAQENLGYCYYYGRLGTVDYEKAFRYFIKGALCKRITSLYKIGDMYKNGYFVEKDEKAAFSIYLACLEALDEYSVDFSGADVHIRLADCAYYGIGTEKRLETAMSHYQIAERLYYERLMRGDFLIKGQYERAVKGQEKVREEMQKTLPDFSWAVRPTEDASLEVK